MMRPREGQLHLGVFGFFGLGNLGNEGSLAALLEHVRCLDTDVHVQCFAGDPQAAGREHEVAATALMSHRPRPPAHGPVETVRKAWGRLVDVPRIWRLVGQVDVVVVPGMGVLEPTLGGGNVWGFPYWQFLAALAARVRRRPFVLLSVGVGVPANRWARFYFGSTLRLARYSTFRDQGSLSAAQRMSGHRSRPGTVSADLAFGLPAPAEVGQPIPGRVVFGVMTPDVRGADADAVTVYAYKVSMATMRLLDRGHSMRLVVGDLADQALAHRIAGLVREHLPQLDDERLEVSDAVTLDGLMVEMARAEVVVASRYHNLVCALMVRRPAVSLSYAGKNAELLADFGLAGYDQPMGAFDLDLLDSHVKELGERRQDLEPEIVRTLARYETALREQYRDLGERVLGPSALQVRTRK